MTGWGIAFQFTYFHMHIMADVFLSVYIMNTGNETHYKKED